MKYLEFGNNLVSFGVTPGDDSWYVYFSNPHACAVMYLTPAQRIELAEALLTGTGRAVFDPIEVWKTAEAFATADVNAHEWVEAYDRLIELLGIDRKAAADAV